MLLNTLKRNICRYTGMAFIVLNLLLTHANVFANNVNLVTSNVNFPCDTRLNTQINIAPQYITFYQCSEASVTQVYSISQNQLHIKGSQVVLSKS